MSPDQTTENRYRIMKIPPTSRTKTSESKVQVRYGIARALEADEGRACVRFSYRIDATRKTIGLVTMSAVTRRDNTDESDRLSDQNAKVVRQKTVTLSSR